MKKKELAVCDECGSLFLKGTSQMEALCPECAHILYGYPNCTHHFQNGRCVSCYWVGSKSEYIKKQNQQEETIMPTTEWMNKYESIRDRLACKTDLDAHFTERVIGNMEVDVPDTDCDLPIFSSGWGDGYYPVYFGYDVKGEVCAVYVRFIDIEDNYKEQA